MEKNTLDKEMISQPELWRLALLVGKSRVDVALYPPLAREQLIWKSFPLDSYEPDGISGLEDVIYDNPLLINDFKSVSCILDYPSIAVPAGLDNDLNKDLYLDQVACNNTAPRVNIYDCGTQNASIAMGSHGKAADFLLRTYYNARFFCRKAEIIKYFLGQNPVKEQPGVMVAINSNTLTMIAVEGKRLLMANDFSFHKDVDAVYYILASMICLGLDTETTTVMVAAMGRDSSELMQLLSRYIARVTPMPFPAMRYRASKDSLSAPLDLLIRPLCE